MKTTIILAIVALMMATGAQALCNDCVMQIIPIQNNICQGDSAIFQIQITNIFDQSKAISLSVASDVALRFDLPSQVIMGPYETKTINVTFTPTKEELGNHRITITAKGYGAEDTDDAIFSVNDCYVATLGLAQSEIAICESSVGNLDFTLGNNGQRADTYTLSVSGIPNTLDVSLPEESIPLAPGVSKTDSITVRPKGKGYGEYTLQLNLNSKHESVYKQFNVNLQDCYHTSVSAPENFITCPDAGLTYEVIVRNAGGVTDTYDIRLEGTCSASADVDSLSLEPGESKEVAINLDRGTVGECDLTVKALSAYKSDSAKTHVIVKKCYDVDLQLSPQERDSCPGEPVTYELKLTNDGYYADSYKLTLSGMNVKLAKDSISLQRGEQDTQTFGITGTWCTRGDIPFAVKAVGHASDAVQGLLRIVEPGEQCAALNLTPAQDPTPIDCEGGSFTFYVKNTGYARQNVKLSLSAPQGYILQPDSVSLVPQESRPIALYLLSSATEKKFPIVITAESEYRKAYLELNVDFSGQLCSVSRPVLEISQPENVSPIITKNEIPLTGTKTPTNAVVSGDNSSLLFTIGAVVITALVLLLLIAIVRGGGSGNEESHFPEVKTTQTSGEDRLAALREAISKSSK